MYAVENVKKNKKEETDIKRSEKVRKMYILVGCYSIFCFQLHFKLIAQHLIIIIIIIHMLCIY